MFRHERRSIWDHARGMGLERRKQISDDDLDWHQMAETEVEPCVLDRDAAKWRYHQDETTKPEE
jgi:hypothetical protein